MRSEFAVIKALLVTSVMVLAIGCGGSDKSKSTAEKKQLPSGVDYDSLQKKAIEFVPKIGKSGGELIISSISDPKSFNPITSGESSTSEFTAYMFEGLIKVNGATLRPEPNLAQSWDVSTDGLVWTFHMRPGVLWSDGNPISAYDVAFTFNDVIFNSSINPCPVRGNFTMEGKKVQVKAIDSSTVQFTLPNPYAPFAYSLMQEILPKHKYQKSVKNGTFANELSIQTKPEQIVGSGPFLLESYNSSQKVVLKRNPHYWKKDKEGNPLPYLDRIIYKIVADQNADLLLFLQGKVEFLEAKGSDFPELKKNETNGNYTVYRLGPTTRSSFVFFNQNTGTDKASGKPYVDKVKLSWFGNKNFRKAVAYALDKDNMIRIVMNGLGYPQWSPMTPSEGIYYNPDVPKYPYDLNKAKQLLESEGFRDKDGDGVIEDKDGNKVEFSLVTNSENNVRAKIAEIIRKDLESIGMKVHFQLIEFNSLVQKLDNPPYEWDAVLLGFTGVIDPHFGNNVWHSKGATHLWNPLQSTPATPWEARIDSLFEAGVRTLDEGQRKSIYGEWQSIAAEELPFIYTVVPEMILCISNKFDNLNPTLKGGMFHNVEFIFKK